VWKTCSTRLELESTSAYQQHPPMPIQLANHHVEPSVSDDRTGLAGVTVVIPALNEEQSLPLVLADLPDVGCVIVVDNGSSDATAIVAARCGATVVAQPQRGYGAACLRGLAAIAERVAAGEQAPRIIAFLDADYSDHPNLLPELIAPILSGEADFVLGSRLLGEREPGAMPPQSVYGNKLACFLMRMLFGARYTDLGPFRVIDYEKLCMLKMADENFGWTIEMQIKASRAGLRHLEIPVPYRNRVGTSKISGTVNGTIKAGTKILYTIAKYGWQKDTPPQPTCRKTDQRNTKA
jgi:glycosyltransferase involved in cell wall biosynthesis